MAIVEIGNANAIEGYRDPTSDDPELVRYRPMDGERVTTIQFPEDYGTTEDMVRAVDAALGAHMAEGNRPEWITSDDEGLHAALLEHFDLPKSAGHKPRSWGRGVED